MTMTLPLTQFCDGSAYLSHMERIRGARGETLDESAYTIPLMYQAVSDKFLPWCANIPAFPYEYKIPEPSDELKAFAKTIKEKNGVAVHPLTIQGKPHSALGKWSIPVIALEDEIWHDNKFHATMIVEVNGEQIGKINTSKEMHFDFAQLIAHAAKTRELSKGTLIGSGTVSSSDINDGFGCFMERNIVTDNKEYLKSGDKVKMYIEEFPRHLLIEQGVV